MHGWTRNLRLFLIEALFFYIALILYLRALEKLVNEKQNDWDCFLEATLFSLRSKVHTTTKHSPFLLMYGREAVFPSEVPADIPVSSRVIRHELKAITIETNPVYAFILSGVALFLCVKELIRSFTCNRAVFLFQLSTILLPEERKYGPFLDEKERSMEIVNVVTVKKEEEEYISISQYQ